MNLQSHVTGLEWKYSSRQKAMLQVIHLAELPEPLAGESIFITDTPPTGSKNGFTAAQPFDVPDFTPYRDIQWDGTTGYMPASYGGWGGDVPILDGWQDWSLIHGDYVGSPLHFVGYAAPARLGGGMCLTLMNMGLLLPGLVGFDSPRGTQAIGFTSHPQPGSYPPSNFQQAMRVSSALYGKGTKWSVPAPGYSLSVIYPEIDSLFLADNITTGTSASNNNYLGITVLPESSISPNYAILEGSLEGLWFGPRNP